jgi:hypothetical protein
MLTCHASLCSSLCRAYRSGRANRYAVGATHRLIIAAAASFAAAALVLI